MPAPLALPVEKFIPKTGELNLTFVLPAQNGCDLKCPGCFIRARGEHDLARLELSVSDYCNFAYDLAGSGHLRCISLQGYEPLLPETRPYTDALLRLAQDLRVPSYLVTNGTNLEAAVDVLAKYRLSGLTVSLDAATAVHHDLARGVSGAFARTVSSLKAVARNPYLRERTLVASVLGPRRHHYLTGVPKLLSSIGIANWVVTPLINPKQSGYCFVEDAAAILPTFTWLNSVASSFGIDFLVDDEFDSMNLNGFSDRGGSNTLKIRRIPDIEKTLRLTPSGHVTMGKAILSVQDWEGPQWKPGCETPAELLAREFNINIETRREYVKTGGAT